MLAIPEVLLRALRIFGRLVAWCAAATVPLLAAGCGGGSPGVATTGSSSGHATVTINAAEQYQRIGGFGVSERFGQAKTLMSWFAKQIKADYGASMFADAWSAPGFTKTNDSAINGGTVCGVQGASCTSGDWRQAYANYRRRTRQRRCSPATATSWRPTRL